MRAIRLLIEYDGSDFVGWQVQAHGRTVQGELASALGILLRENIVPVGSGRTDAGTHALGQVAHFHTHSSTTTERILRGLNGILPNDICIHAVDEVELYFHARFSAKRKRYRYRIHLGKNAVQRHYTWSLHTALDIERMQAASAYLKGTHCFDAFCKQDPVPEQFSCTVYAADWHCKGRELIFEIEGNRFLRHMVRILVGTMVEIGLGKHPPEHLNHLLERGRREEAGKTAPACGLHLLWVHYDNA